MRKIDVQITKGKIKSFSVTLKDDLPVVSAVVSLFTADDKEITTFSISTEAYYDTKFDLPISMIPAIKNIAEELEAIVIQECNKKMACLPAPAPEKAVA